MCMYLRRILRPTANCRTAVFSAFGGTMLFSHWRTSPARVLARTSFRAAIVAVAALEIAGPLPAEQFLKVGSKRFLGWQTSKSVFTTCGKTDIPLSEGQLEKT